MADKSLKEAFEASYNDQIVSGSIKFSNKYCSQFDIYKAATKWAQSDAAVVYASIGTSGDDFIVIDFRFDEELSKKRPKSFTHDYIKPLFEEMLGGDYIQAWSINRGCVVIK